LNRFNKKQQIYILEDEIRGACVARRAEMSNVHEILVGKPEWRDQLGDLCGDGKEVLKWI